MKKIILAVDLRAENPQVARKVWGNLKALGCAGKHVEPVSILNREDAAIAKSLQKQIGGLTQAAKKHLGEQMDKWGIRDSSAPQILFANGSSTHQAVGALLEHAEKSGAELIALSTHARKGLKRLFLGSFAETLALKSPIPLLVVNANQPRSPKSIKSVLFATDFSEESKGGLEALTGSLGKGGKYKVILYHCFVPFNRVYVDPFLSFSPPPSFWEEEFTEAQKNAAEWKERLQALGFQCEVVMDRRSALVTNGIIKHAKKLRAGMIALVSTSGKLEGNLLGSVTRQVLRESTLPVWIVHPK